MEVGLEEILSQFSVFSVDSFQLWNLALAFYVFCLWGTQTALTLSPNICLPLCYKIRGESFTPVCQIIEKYWVSMVGLVSTTIVVAAIDV